MRYIDSGSRSPDQALGAWLQGLVAASVAEIRVQSGFFSADALGILTPALERLTRADQVTKILIGSNGPGTPRNDVVQLLGLLGIPRANADLGVVKYSNAFYHPKTYHFRRPDGSQSAYVGSANLTAQGVASLHIEAGLVLDTQNGDPVDVLDQIAAAIDDWFNTNREGLQRIADLATIDRLTTEGVLAAAPPPRPSTGSGSGSPDGTPAQPRLQPLVALPAPPASTSTPAAPAPPPSPAASANPSAPRTDFPAYLLFAPNATAPTRGPTALSGAILPGAAEGLVIRLNRDSARRFGGRSGTANISIPVATISTLRFGIYQGKYQRPRAEYGLYLRYLGSTGAITLAPAETSIMAYGVAPGESGHRDVRMLVPAAVHGLARQVQQAQLPVPAEGDLATLEWPTGASPEFRLTFVERGTPLFQQIELLFDRASASSQLVGDGACWLPPGVSPAW